MPNVANVSQSECWTVRATYDEDAQALVITRWREHPNGAPYQWEIQGYDGLTVDEAVQAIEGSAWAVAQPPLL